MQASEGKWKRGGIRRGTWVLLGFLGVAAFFLLTEHRAHAIEYLPLLLLAACPLMHLFHGHGGHRHGDSDRSGTTHRHDGGTPP